MSSGSVVDHHGNSDYSSQPRGFLTPPPSWGRRRCSPATMPGSEKQPRRSPLFHVIHKVPSGDSPYVRAKHAQLIDKDPSRAISLFWAAINSSDRVDSALKDMAVVMKQLDRSDEAIEAIKSFRHLCPHESQESLDNILVELYKQSGRIDEEIEMLQVKLKQVEEGIAFGGKRKKMARSQGKKIHITVEKEYSRLLGNLAWAYMQQKDFKSAEEHYRKALSFVSDKNKQCNLAICLMHMNKLTEAKFLLQSIKASSENGCVDESYSKSYERAYEMLVEFESQRGLNPIKQTQYRGGLSEANNGFCSKKYGASTDFPYEKRADFSWRKDNQEEAYSQLKRVNESPSCIRVIPRAPFTQPRRSEDQKIGGFTTDHGYGFSCRKLSFESSICTGNAQSAVNQNGNYYYSTGHPSETPRVIPRFLGKNFSSTDGNWRKNSWDNLGTMKETNEGSMNSDKNSGEGCMLTSVVSNGTYERKPNLHSACERKTWADMVEEDEQDENLNTNIIQETPRSMDQAEKLNQMIERINLGSGYLSQPEKTTLQMNQSTTARRSLCFDQSHNSPLKTKVLNFEGQDVGILSEDSSSSKSMKRRNRLQVFQNITP